MSPVAPHVPDAPPAPSPSASPGDPVVATVGLDPAEAERRLAAYGPNRLVAAPPRPAYLRFLDQFRSFLVLILIGAAVLAAAVGDLKDPIPGVPAGEARGGRHPLRPTGRHPLRPTAAGAG